MEKSEYKAAYHLLQLAEMGYQVHEVPAQWLASIVVEGDEKTQDMSMRIGEMCIRIVELIDTPGQFWPGMLANGDMSGPSFETFQLETCSCGANLIIIDDLFVNRESFQPHTCGGRIEHEPEEDAKTTTCLVVAMRRNRFSQVLLLWGVDDGTWYGSNAAVKYTIVNQATEVKQLSEGDTIEIEDRFLDPFAPEEVADFLNTSF